MKISRITLTPIGWMRIGDNGLLSLGPLRRPRGEPERHVTIPLKPDRRGRIRPHLTIDDHGKKYHDDLLNLSFEDWIEIFKQTELAVAHAYQAALVPTTLEELQDLDYFVSCPSAEDLFFQLKGYWDRRGKNLSIRFSDDLLFDFLQVVFQYAKLPHALKPEEVRGHPALAFRLDDNLDFVDGKLLMYCNYPVGLGEKPGWYTMVPDALSVELALHGFIQCLGSDFFRMVEAMVQHLGGTPDAERWTDFKRRYG